MSEYTLKCKECGEIHKVDEEELLIAGSVGCARCCGGTVEKVSCPRCGHDESIEVGGKMLTCRFCNCIWKRPELE